MSLKSDAPICVVCNQRIDTRFRYKLNGTQASHMPSEICARYLNTFCPKIGSAQWSCTYEECTCHLKESIKKPEFPWFGTFQEQSDWAEKYGESKSSDT